MPLLQPKLSLKIAQRQILTPGLMQMVSVLALNKLELKEMIDAEMVENPVLEEIDESVPMLDAVAGPKNPRLPLKTLSTKSTLDRTSRSISTLATARSRSLKRAKGPRSRTFSPSLRLFPITWRGNWGL